MSAHAVTLELPGQLYDLFKGRAERTRRSVESEILETVATAAWQEESLPEDLDRALAELEALDDQALWRAARTRLDAEESTRLEALNRKQQGEGLTPAEKDVLWQLVDRYERSMLIRAESAKLLKERGHDVSALLTAT